MRSFTKKILHQTAFAVGYFVLIFLCTFAISFTLLNFVEMYSALDAKNHYDSATTADFVWQIVLLGFVGGAAIFTVPKNKELSAWQMKRLYLSGCCTLASSAFILIGYSVTFFGITKNLWLIPTAGGVIVDGGIILMCWGISMAAIELIGVLILSIRKLFS